MLNTELVILITQPAVVAHDAASAVFVQRPSSCSFVRRGIFSPAPGMQLKELAEVRRDYAGTLQAVRDASMTHLLNTVGVR